MPNPAWRNANSGEDTSDANIESDIRSGDSDTDISSYWEYVVNAGEGHIDWFPGSGFDSGERGFTLTFNPGGGQGGASFVVDVGSLAEDDSLAYGDITKVAIAVASSVGAIELKNVAVACFVNGVPVSSDQTCIMTTAMMQQNAGTAIVPPLSCTNVNPRYLDCPSNTTKIVVTGKVRLVAQGEPGADDLIAYFFVWHN